MYNDLCNILSLIKYVNNSERLYTFTLQVNTTTYGR